MNREQEVLIILFERYEKIIIEKQDLTLPEFIQKTNKNSPEHLLRLIHEAKTNIAEYPSDKLHRWLGYIQGVLTCYQWIDVDEERNFTRPLLHSFHHKKIKSFG